MLGFGGSGLVHATASYSDYDTSKASASGTGASITQTGITNVRDASFANAATGNYHLLPGSPLIDAGAPGTSQGLDLDKKALVTDGNADGSARRDVGPFELPALASPPPPPPAGRGDPAPSGGGGHRRPARPPTAVTRRPRSSPDSAPPARPSPSDAPARRSRRVRGTRFRYTLSENAKVTVMIKRRNGRSAGKLVRTGKKGANRLKLSGRIGRRALGRGRYRAVITATDAAGNRCKAPRRVKHPDRLDEGRDNGPRTRDLWLGMRRTLPSIRLLAWLCAREQPDVDHEVAKRVARPAQFASRTYRSFQFG